MPRFRIRTTDRFEAQLEQVNRTPQFEKYFSSAIVLRLEENPYEGTFLSDNLHPIRKVVSPWYREELGRECRIGVYFAILPERVVELRYLELRQR